MKCFFTFLVALAFQGILTAQDDCDCEIDFDEPVVCVQDENGEIFPVPNACFADCLGLPIVEADCGGFGWEDPEDPWDDCDCEIDYDEPFVCAQDSAGVQCVVPNACFADCLGLTIIEDGCDDLGDDGPWDGCDCEIDFDEPVVCVQDENGEIFPVPNACFAGCLGLPIVEADCGGFGWEDPEDPWDDCDCEIDYDEPFVCAQDSAGVHCVVPNACFADCLGLTIVEDGCDDLGDWGGCDCEVDPNEPAVCVQDESGGQYLVPNACLADCWGLTIVEGGCDSSGDDAPWGDCDCEVDYNEPFVCVENENGDVFPLPNACIADCWGLAIVEEDCEGSGWDDPFEDCDCEIDYDEPFVCAQDSTGVQCLVPNACFADCLGLTIVEDGCDDWGGDIDPDLLLCIEAIDINAFDLFQTYLLLLNSECGLPLDDCVLNAPEFDNDEDFFTYLMDNCLDDGDIQDDDSMLRLFNSFRNTDGATATSTTAKASLINEVALIQNPVTDVLRYRVTAANPNRITVRLLGISGQTLQQETLEAQTGLNDYSLDMGNLPAGLYLLSVMGENSLTTLRFVRK